MIERTFLLAFSVMFIFMSPAWSAEGILGQWEAENGKTRIEIKQCEDAFCGFITWLKKPRKDANNENPALRDRDLIGVQIAKDMRPTSKNKWKGEVYSAKQGKIFQSSVKLKGDTISIKGCLTSAGLLCKTVKYIRL